LRIEQVAPTDAEASRAVETLTTLLVVLKSVEQTQMQMHPNTPSDAEIRELVNSAKIEQHKDRAVLTASIPLDLVKRMTTPSSDGRP
jgi:Mg-chelatase subunit ChlI